MKSTSSRFFRRPSATGGMRHRGLTIVFLTGVIVLTLGVSYVIMGMMERRAHSSASRLVSEVVSHIDVKMYEVETATRDASNRMIGNLGNPEALEQLVRDFVAQSSFIYGSTVAFEPDVFPERGRTFAPYSWKTADGQVHSRQLGTETDYYEEEWYAQTKLRGTEYWCEPYFDEGGAKIMMCTFSIPLKDNAGKLVAVMTADVGLDDLEEYIATINPDGDSFIILRSKSGVTLADSGVGKNLGDNTVFIKGTAAIGWTVELMMTFDQLIRGDIGFVFIIGFIMLIALLAVYFMVRLLARLQRMESEQYMNVIGALSQDFISVDFVELKDDKLNDQVMEYRVTPELVQRIPGWEAETYFTKKLNLLIEHLVYAPDREQFYEETRRENIFSLFDHTDTCFINFRFLIDGDIRYYQYQFSAVRQNGIITGVVAGLHSIDEQMKQEKQQQATLRQALAKAESASKAKTDFLFNMSHDIRTPMNAILGYTDVAIRHFDNKEQAMDSLRKIKSSSLHLLGLINDILEMSRVESGTLEITEHQADLRNLIDKVDDMGQALSIPKSIHFRTIIDELSNPHVYIDELHFGEVVINLVSNAVKYTGEDGNVIFRICQLTSPVDCIATYRFEVTDNGIGMSDEFQQHLFDAFARERTSTVSRQQGSGLGLSIVKKIVDLSGGQIFVRSKVGEGTTMTVEIPLRVMSDEEVEAFGLKYNHADTAAHEKVKLEGKRVLLVEDNELNREIAEMIISEAGLNVESAEDGDVAVRKVKEQGIDYYDFILMDIQMPVMNGYEATRAIRALPGGADIPIIAVSANAFEEDRQKSLEAGMNDHIAKPIDIDELFQSMRKLA